MITPLHHNDFVTNPHTNNVINMKELIERIEFAKCSIHLNNPCFGSLLDNLIFIYTFDYRIQTQATDGSRIFINPEWTSKLTDNEIRFVLVHELLHAVLNHINRFKNHNKEYANIAADFEVNGMAYLDNFTNIEQISKLDLYFSLDYILYDNNLLPYEEIYKDLVKRNFIDTDIKLKTNIKYNLPKNTENYTLINSTDSWKNGHSLTKTIINDILANEYKKSLSKPYTVNNVSNSLKNAINTIKNFLKYDNADLKYIFTNFNNHNYGRTYCIEESIFMINAFIDNINNIPNSPYLTEPFNKINPNYIIKTHPNEPKLFLPKLINEQLQNDDIINQNTGSDIAKNSGYSDDESMIEQDFELSSKWESILENALSKNGSDNLKRVLINIKKSNYNWKNELKRYMFNSILNYKNHKKEWGNKKGLARNEMTLKPKSIINSINDIIFLVDCSGSISNNTLSFILNECAAIVKQCNVNNVTYAYFTTNVNIVETNNVSKIKNISNVSVKKLINNKPSCYNITGGTSFKNALDWVVSIGGAKCVVLLTDGYDVPIKKPSKINNLIWCVFDNKYFNTVDNSKLVRINNISNIKTLNV